MTSVPGSSGSQVAVARESTDRFFSKGDVEPVHFTGPIFAREAVTAPRRLSHYLLRSGLLAGLLVLFYSLREATIGFQDVQFAGDVAGFSALTFQVFAFLQFTVTTFFSTLFSAATVAQEKDRKTLILLLMTDMRNRELALGKLTASLLLVGVLVAATIPVYFCLRLLGGVDWQQIVAVEVLVFGAALCAGAWGTMVAFQRQKTFQTLAVSVLGVVFGVVVLEAVAALARLQGWGVLGEVAPYSALSSILNPLAAVDGHGVLRQALPAVCLLFAAAAGFTVVTIKRLRIWNPSQAVYRSAAEKAEDEEGASQTTGRIHHRKVWDNPVIWREVRTRAYGSRIFWIKLAYVVMAAGSGWMAINAADTESLILGMVNLPAFCFLGVAIISLLLTNAQAVTSVTTERDERTLEVLLVTDLTAREFIAGKIGGALWNAREMIVVPLLLLVGISVGMPQGGPGLESGLYVVLGFLVLSVFSVMLGLHAGMTYENSRQAIANSLGTMFFLFLGIFVFMLLLVEARSSFAIQIQSFVLFIGFGSLGLYTSLTHKNPSNALTLASALLPFMTFYAITDFLLDGTLGVCFWICVSYGFAVVAMLIPAVSDFDVALGRTTRDDG